MRSRVRVAGHPMLVALPPGLPITSVVFDVLHLTTGGASSAVTA